MKATKIDSRAGLRRLLVRLGIAALYLALIALAFVTGKGHTILVDNKDRADGFAAVDGILVSVDGREPLELYSGDRDLVKVKGQRHRVRIERVNGGESRELSVSLPMDGDMLLLSVPKLAAGRDDVLEPFVQRDQPAPKEEPVGNTNEFTSPGGQAEPGAPAP